MRLPWLLEQEPELFPPTDSARTEPNGLLAAGGDLQPVRLLNAYARGIFPWYNPGEPILWWAPDPRLVLVPEQVKCNARLLRWIRLHGNWQVRIDDDFAEVLAQCAAPREENGGTWLGAEMQDAYLDLHQLGYAHCLEIYQDEDLLAGVYGVQLGRVFFAESMFGHANNASKIALLVLCAICRQQGIALIDCQVRSEHLIDRGAKEIPRSAFEALLDTYIDQDSLVNCESWQDLPKQHVMDWLARSNSRDKTSASGAINGKAASLHVSEASQNKS
jgi:leucyl/phenylalanyl-tRNA---protein transferase